MQIKQTIRNVGGLLGAEIAGMSFLTSNGAPEGTSDLQADALVGSFCRNCDSANGDIYKKVAAGSGADKWECLPSGADVEAINARIDEVNTSIDAVNASVDAVSTRMVAAEQEAARLEALRETLRVDFEAFMATKGQAGGLATLGADSLIPTSMIPSIALNDVMTVSSLAEVTTVLTTQGVAPQAGDIVIVLDTVDQSKNGAYHLLSDADSTLIESWIYVPSVPDAIVSINGQMGAVVLSAADVGADVSGAAQQVQDNLNAEIENDRVARAALASDVDAKLLDVDSQLSDAAQARADSEALVLSAVADEETRSKASESVLSNGLGAHDLRLADMERQHTVFEKRASFNGVTAQLLDTLPRNTGIAAMYDVVVVDENNDANVTKITLEVLNDGVNPDFDESNRKTCGLIEGLYFAPSMASNGDFELTVHTLNAVNVSFHRTVV